jgi:hypothetical protein
MASEPASSSSVSTVGLAVTTRGRSASGHSGVRRRGRRLPAGHREHRQQGAQRGQPGPSAVGRDAVDVRQDRVDAGFGDAQRRRVRAAQGHGELERLRLVLLEAVGDGGEVRLDELGVGRLAQRLADLVLAGQRLTAFQAQLDVLDRPVADVDHLAGDRDRVRPVRGDHPGGHLLDVQAQPHLRLLARLAGQRHGRPHLRGGRRSDGQPPAVGGRGGRRGRRGHEEDPRRR